MARRVSLWLYCLLTLPGIVFAAAIRPFFFSDNGGSLVLGLLVTFLPFLLLSIALLLLTRVPELPLDTSKDIASTNSVIGWIAILGFFIFVFFIISGYQRISDIIDGSIYANSYYLPVYTLSTWLSGCFMGWSILFFGFSTLLRRNNIKSDNSS